GLVVQAGRKSVGAFEALAAEVGQQRAEAEREVVGGRRGIALTVGEAFGASGEAVESARGELAAASGAIEAAGDQLGPFPRPGRAGAEQAAAGSRFVEPAAELGNRTRGSPQARPEAAELGGRAGAAGLELGGERAERPGRGGDRRGP